ncbi:CHAT domain-containing protein [Gordonia sp. X0973]|uniref:CHAT domain-containing protein n=1 Tax=Gordonia sp. X0973 TaxID=2742602 RepID=UPI000F52F430|nr:CHAT domain-containing protein [Gordonia sp. X0973]QKT07959.1 CHAT domain-containing protein [Gordonia sp. X0973]
MPATPTLLVKYAEAGDCYLTWRWIGPDGPDDFAGVARIDRAEMSAVRTALAEAVPDQLPGESIADGIDRALLRGPFSHPEATEEFLRRLRTTLIPDDLRALLRDGPTRPVLRIQPSESLTRVPWEILLDDLADVVGSAPASAGTAHVEIPALSDGPLLAVIDPRIPGQSASSALGSVLGRPTSRSPLARLLDDEPDLRPAASTYADLARRTDLDRAWLHQNLPGTSRFLYVGHVTAASSDDESVDAALHLCDVDDDGAHRGLRAVDLLTGGFRFPPRTAVIGCNSGADLAHPDGMGLSVAALASGAQLVTATRWAVPTDHALARAGDLADRHPLEDLVLAVAAAHRDADPLRSLAKWRRECRARWNADAHPADNPLLWAAITSTA